MLRMIRWFTVFYVIVLTLLLELPGIRQVDFVDVSVAGYEHLITFTLLGFLVELSRNKQSILFWVGMLFLYSFGTEVLQGLLNPICHRVFDWRDLFHNVLGVLLGTLIGHFCRSFVSCRDV